MQYVIWSFEHRRWWRPDSEGYTPDLREAGRYSKAEAGDIVTSSILLEEVAIYETFAIKMGPPKYHPHNGEVTG